MSLKTWKRRHVSPERSAEDRAIDITFHRQFVMLPRGRAPQRHESCSPAPSSPSSTTDVEQDGMKPRPEWRIGRATARRLMRDDPQLLKEILRLVVTNRECARHAE